MQSIPCPQCKTQIEFDVKDILQGKDFTCTTCNTKIKLAYQDNKSILDKAKAKLDQLKDDLNID